MNISNYYISFSIVSHGQGDLISPLLLDLSKLTNENFEVIITINLPEDETPFMGHPFPLRIIRNEAPKGFGANHNAAFAKSNSVFFAVVNPDIRIQFFDLQILLLPFKNWKVAAIAPLVLSGEGKIEDNARRFPTMLRFSKRVLLAQRYSDYTVDAIPYPVDWVAGMFIVFRSETFKRIGGFDDRRFFMYLEDADICRRIWENGDLVLVNPNVEVIHLAQRASRKKMKFMWWHLVSAFRYLTGL